MFSIFGMDASSGDVVSDIDEFRRSYSFNTGNLLFSYGVRKIADLHHQPISWGAKKENINKSSQGLIMPMANQLGAHFDFNKDGPSLDGVDVPVVAIGLGAQFPTNQVDYAEIPDGTVEWLKKLAEKSPEKNIGVRGDATFSVLENLGLGGSVEVVGCPSNFINKSSFLGREIKKKIELSNFNDKKISIVSGNPYLSKLSGVEKNLLSWIEKYNADYVVQHPKVLIELASSWPVQDDALEVVRKRWFGELDSREIPEWFSLNSSVYVSVPQWLLDFSKKELVVGTRIHGIQAALQAGTPGLCLYVDSRTKELCETMHVPHINAESAQSLTIENAWEILSNWDWGYFDQRRRELARVSAEFIMRNGVKVSSHLKALADF